MWVGGGWVEPKKSSLSSLSPLSFILSSSSWEPNPSLGGTVDQGGRRESALFLFLSFLSSFVASAASATATATRDREEIYFFSRRLRRRFSAAATAAEEEEEEMKILEKCFQ